MNRRFDAIVIGAGQAGPPMAGGSPRPAEGRPHRAQADRRNLRQHRLHADQDSGRQRLCGASRTARRRLRRQRRTLGVDFAAVMARKDKISTAALGPRSLAQGHGELRRRQGHARFLSPTTVKVGDDVLEGTASSSTSVAGPTRPISRASIRRGR